MSKSFKRTPGGKFFGSSDKEDKVAAHKKFRRSTKNTMKIQPNEVDYYDEDGELIDTELEYQEPPQRIREVSDIYNFSSDGGSYYVGEEYANTSNSTKKAFIRK